MEPPNLVGSHGLNRWYERWAFHRPRRTRDDRVWAMLLIPCPWCGPRDEVEFHYGGQAGVAFPADPDALDDAAWAEYLFFRDNPKGPFGERWVHSAGCRRWFDVVRDTVTHEFLAAPATAAGGTPALGAEGSTPRSKGAHLR
jgi:heterotetrameric sarcosine oxidase delta subunit